VIAAVFAVALTAARVVEVTPRPNCPNAIAETKVAIESIIDFLIVFIANHF
jgi:hypothetical protein